MKLPIAIVALVAAGAIPLAAGVAEAAPPEPAIYTVPIPETPCGAFTLDVVDRTKAHLVTLHDGTVLVHAAGPLAGVLTSEESGRSMSISFSGPTWITPKQVVLTGPTLLFSPTLLELVDGRTVVKDPSATWQVTGRVTLLCPLLNP